MVEINILNSRLNIRFELQSLIDKVVLTKFSSRVIIIQLHAVAARG